MEYLRFILTASFYLFFSQELTEYFDSRHHAVDRRIVYKTLLAAKIDHIHPVKACVHK